MLNAKQAQADFIAAVRDAMSQGLTMPQILAHVPNPGQAARDLQEAGMGSNAGAIDAGYQQAVNGFLSAWRAATAGGEAPALLARLPNPQLARVQLKLAKLL